VVIGKPIEGILGLSQSQVINHLQINFMGDLKDDPFVAYWRLNVIYDYVLFIKHG
jgi:hypothetical protein